MDALSFFKNKNVFVISLLVTVTVPEPVTPITTTAPQMPLMMQLYTSPDYRSPLDPNTKVQSDKRIYAEVRNHSPSLSCFFFVHDLIQLLHKNS